MTSRLTGLIDMVSRTQDTSSVAFSALTPPNPRSADFAHEEKLKKGHYVGTGLGVALQAHLRERQFRAKSPEDLASKAASESDDEERRKRGSLTNTIRKSGVELPASVVRVLEHHRKKGIARQEAYLNESLLSADGGPRSSRSAKQRKSSRRELSHSPSLDTEDMARVSRQQGRRMTASRLVADSIIVGAPKGSISAMASRSPKGSAESPSQKGASRLAVQAAGSAACHFFSPEHFLVTPEPQQSHSHVPPALASPGTEASTTLKLSKDKPKAIARNLLKHFQKMGPSARSSLSKPSSGARSSLQKKPSSSGKTYSGKNQSMKTLRATLGAKLDAKVKRMTKLAESSGNKLDMLWPDMDVADGNASPTGQAVSTPDSKPRRLSAAIEDEAAEDSSDSNTRSTAATSSSPRRTSGLVSPGQKPKTLEDLFSAIVKGEQTSDKASLGAETPKISGRRKSNEVSMDSTPQGEPREATPKSPETTMSSSAAPEEKKPLLFCGDKQPLDRKGVRLTLTPFNFKVMIQRSSKKRTTKPPPPLEYPPPAPAPTVRIGESDSAKKRPEFVRPRRLSDAELEKVPLKLISWSSQRDNGRRAAANLVRGEAGTLWESVGPSDQSLTFDSGSDVEVCGLVLRCLGTKADPKDVTLLRSNTVEGPWIIVRRCFVPAGPQNRDKRKHQFLFEPGGPAQYWRFIIHQNWGAAFHTSIFAPLELLVRKDDKPFQMECDSLPQGLQVSKIDEAWGRRSLTLLFSECLNLSKEDREVRNVARRNGIPLDWAERVRDEFRKFTVGNDLCYADFAKIVETMLVTGGGSRAQKSDVPGIPEARIHHLWNEVEGHNTGQVDFEDFLVWFHSMFYCESAVACSQHAARQAAIVNERFYASMGRERLRQAVHKQELRQRRLQDDGVQ